MDISVYGEDRGALVRFDPRTKFVVFLASLAVSANSFNATAHELYCFVLCVMLFLCGKKWNAVKMALMLGLAVYVRTCMEMQATGAKLVVTIISFLVTIFLYCFPILVSLLIITQTTRVNQFLSAFQAMHIPTWIVIPIAVMFRFIPTVGEESGTGYMIFCDKRRELGEHLRRLPMGYFTEGNLGKISSVLSQDMVYIEEQAMTIVADVVSDIFSTVLTCVFMFVFHPLLGAVTLAVDLLAVLIAQPMIKRSLADAQNRQKSIEGLTSAVLENHSKVFITFRNVPKMA